MAAQVVVKQEPSEKATPSRATRVSLRASRAQKSNPEESSKDADEKLPTPVPSKSETRSTRSKSPAIAALKKEVDLSQIKKEYISPNTVIKLEAGLVESPKPLLPELDEENSDEIKEENEEETVETEIKPEKPKTEGRATRRRTMPAISKSVKPVATRAPSTPKPQPTRQTQNKFKVLLTFKLCLPTSISASFHDGQLPGRGRGKAQNANRRIYRAHGVPVAIPVPRSVPSFETVMLTLLENVGFLLSLRFVSLLHY